MTAHRWILSSCQTALSQLAIYCMTVCGDYFADTRHFDHQHAKLASIASAFVHGTRNSLDGSLCLFLDGLKLSEKQTCCPGNSLKGVEAHAATCGREGGQCSE